MRFQLMLVLMLSVVLGLSKVALGAPSLSGDYRGVLRLEQTQSELLARLHMVVTRTDDHQLRLTGFLALYLGDYASDEYVSFLFDDIRYNLLTGDLVFDQADRDVSMRTTAFRDGFLELSVQSQWAGLAGRLILQKDAIPVPEQSLLPKVSGSYSGQCGGQDSFLELQTLRNGSSEEAANPFAAYQVTGRVGERHQGLCPDSGEQPCVTNLILSGSYDIYRGRLDLVGRQGVLSCEVSVSSLRCGPCTYAKFEEAVLAPMVEPMSASPIWGLPPRSVEPGRAIGGYYQGYLHHERLDQYQPLSFDLITYRDREGETEELQMSAVARLSFGSSTSRETLVYRFERQPFQLLAEQFLFKHPEDGHDARPLVTVMDGERLEGYWYSSIYGRVGSFKLKKSSTVELPSAAAILRPLTGTYGSEGMTLNVVVDRIADAASAADPFSPLGLTGYFWYRSGIMSRIPVSAAGYDFFTGKIGFETDEGSRVATGTRMLDGSIRLRWQALRYGALLQAGREETFRLGM